MDTELAMIKLFLTTSSELVRSLIKRSYMPLKIGYDVDLVPLLLLYSNPVQTQQEQTNKVTLSQIEMKWNVCAIGHYHQLQLENSSFFISFSFSLITLPKPH